MFQNVPDEFRSVGDRSAGGKGGEDSAEGAGCTSALDPIPPSLRGIYSFIGDERFGCPSSKPPPCSWIKAVYARLGQGVIATTSEAF